MSRLPPISCATAECFVVKWYYYLIIAVAGSRACSSGAHRALKRATTEPCYTAVVSPYPLGTLQITGTRMSRYGSLAHGPSPTYAS